MSTSYPGTNDSFSVPSAPSTTPLSSAGTGTLDHVQSHQNLGDAIVALQQNASPLAHDHSGTEARPTSKLAQANTHQSPDTDSAATALHHTLGTGATQAAAGNHTHDYNGPTILNQPYRLCTSASRPLTPTVGMKILETDTGRTRVWLNGTNGLAWLLTTEGVVPHVRVSQGVAQNMPNGPGGTIVEWHNRYEDSFGNFNPATSLTNFYASEPGLYRVDYSIAWEPNLFADATGVGIRVNGVPLATNPADRWQYTRGQFAGIVQNVDGWGEVRMNAGDYVSIWAGHNALFNQMTSVGTPQESRLTMRYIGF